MQTHHELAIQLQACRDYLSASLGHIPEVLKLIREIDSVLQSSEEEPQLHGAVYTSAGVPLIEVAVHGAHVHLCSRVSSESRLSDELVAKLQKELLGQLALGLNVPLTKKAP